MIQLTKTTSQSLQLICVCFNLYSFFHCLEIHVPIKEDANADGGKSLFPLAFNYYNFIMNID